MTSDDLLKSLELELNEYTIDGYIEYDYLGTFDYEGEYNGDGYTIGFDLINKRSYARDDDNVEFDIKLLSVEEQEFIKLKEKELGW